MLSRKVLASFLLPSLLYVGSGWVCAAPAQPAATRPSAWTQVCRLRGLSNGELTIYPDREKSTTDIVLRRSKSGPVVAREIYPEYIDEPEVDCEGDSIRFIWLTGSGQYTQRLQLRLKGTRLIVLLQSEKREKTNWRE